MPTIIRNATIINEGKQFVADMLIENNLINKFLLHIKQEK
jgi:dihydroorotase-like cyclic amidohydrolase